jgi:transcriptional regulator with XRE-family HTH domain
VPLSILPERTFAEKLRKARIEAGMTQKELSLAAGLSKDLVWRWENEKHDGRRWAVERVMAVLGEGA